MSIPNLKKGTHLFIRRGEEITECIVHKNRFQMSLKPVDRHDFVYQIPEYWQDLMHFIYFFTYDDANQYLQMQKEIWLKKLKKHRVTPVKEYDLVQKTLSFMGIKPSNQIADDIRNFDSFLAKMDGIKLKQIVDQIHPTDLLDELQKMLEIRIEIYRKIYTYKTESSMTESKTIFGAI